jgi:hypothetical protein
VRQPQQGLNVNRLSGKSFCAQKLLPEKVEPVVNVPKSWEFRIGNWIAPKVFVHKNFRRDWELNTNNVYTKKRR